VSYSRLVVREPKVALFWFVPDEAEGSRLVCVRWLLDCDERLQLQCAPCCHLEAWHHITALDRSLEEYSHEFFPRGRLEFYPPTRRWIFSIDTQLARGDFVEYLTDTWLLPRGHLTVIDDPDYRSAIVMRSPYFPPSGHFVVEH